MGAATNIDSDFTTMTRNGASLRDPAGYVFEFNGRVYRRLTRVASRDWRAFASSSLATQLIEQGFLIGTRPATDIVPTQCANMDAPGTNLEETDGLVLLHERVPVVTYAQEWCFSLLRDAALLHLDLITKLLPAGWILKDANPSNVQWVNGRLTLIDVTSIEPYRAGPWRAYGQFCRTMLFPLMVSSHGRLPLQPLLKGHGLGGMDSATASRLLRGRASFNSGVWMHVHFQNWLHGLSGRRQSGGMGKEFTSGFGADAVLRMVAGLRRILEVMPTPAPTAWSGYRFSSTYTDAQMHEKRERINEWCAAQMKQTDIAMDVGCNTGEFSEVLARHASQVISIDADMPCIDDLYRRAVPRVLPLVVDAADPTPSAGWALKEQKAFPLRVRGDWSVWLAVIHHLAIHNGVRLDEVVRGIVGTSPKIIIEFVSPEDDMVRALLAERGVERPDYTEGHFLSLLRTHGVEVLDRHIITATRSLYLLKRNEDR